MNFPMDFDEPGFSPTNLEEPANRLLPNDMKKLGRMLSSGSNIFGPCWEIVADQLNFSSEVRTEIRDMAEQLKETVGYLVLKRWAESDPASHTLLVLRSALERCQRQDIMEFFDLAVRNMDRVTMHVVVKFPPDCQDTSQRLQRLREETNCRTTLEQLLENKLEGELTDYDITTPKWATWDMPASALKGNMVTITRQSSHETLAKAVARTVQEATIMDSEVSSSTGNQNTFVRNISLKLENIDQKVDNNFDGVSYTDNCSTMQGIEPEDTYVPMNRGGIPCPGRSPGIKPENASLSSNGSETCTLSLDPDSFHTTLAEWPGADTYQGCRVEPCLTDGFCVEAHRSPHNKPRKWLLESSNSPPVQVSETTSLHSPQIQQGYFVQSSSAVPIPAWKTNPFACEPRLPPPDICTRSPMLRDQRERSNSQPALNIISLENGLSGKSSVPNPYNRTQQRSQVDDRRDRSGSNPHPASGRALPDSHSVPGQGSATAGEENNQVRVTHWPDHVRLDVQKGRRVPSSSFLRRATDQLVEANFFGWHGELSMEQLYKVMYPYCGEDGWYIVWRSCGQSEREDKLVVTVTHDGRLLHYNIRARSVNRHIYYYLFKSLYRNASVANLLEYYRTQCVETKLNPDTGTSKHVQLYRAVQ